MSSAAFHARFLRLLLGAVGATTACAGAFVAPGCGGKVVVDEGNGSGAAGGGGAGQSSSSSSSSTSPSFTSSTSSSSSSGGTNDCTSHLVSGTQQSPAGTCVTDPNVLHVNVNCF